MMNTFKRLSLKTRLAVLGLGVFLVCIWVLTLNTSRMLYRDMQRMLGEQQFSTVSRVAEDINEELEERLESLEKVASEVTHDMMASPAVLQVFLERQTVFQELFNAGIFITDIDGTPVADFPVSAGRIGLNVMDRDYMIAALKEGKSSIGKPVLGKSLKRPVFSMAAPIRGAHGAVIGALVGVTSLAKSNFLDRITDFTYGLTGGYLIVDSQHRFIITGTDKRRVMEPSPAPGVSPLTDRFLAGYEGSGIGVNPHGVEMLASANGIPVAGWYVNAALPTVEAFAPVESLRRRIILAAFIVSMLACGLTWLIIKSQRLNKALQLQVDDKAMELLRSERRFRTIVEESNDLIYTLSPEGVITYVAPNVETLLGYLSIELTGRSFQPLIHPDDLPGCIDFLRQVLTTKMKRQGLEYRIRHKDGRWLWFISNASMVSDITGVPIFLGIGRDINDRKQIEIALRESEEKHRILLEESSDAIFSITPEGRYRYANPAFARGVGKPLGEIIGKTFWDVFPKDEADKRFAFVSKACRAGEIDVLEVCFPSADGDRYFMTTLTPIKDAEGQTLIAICSARNITALKNTEKSLRELSNRLEMQKVELQQLNESLERRVEQRTAELNAERQRLAGIIEGTNAGTWEWNVQTGELTLNERWAAIIGYTLEEISPVSIETWKSFVHPDDLKPCERLLERHFRGELDYYEFESRMRHKNGGWVWVLDRGKVTAWTDDGKPLLMLGTHQDITGRKLAEETLITSNRRFAQLAEHSRTVVWEVDANGLYTYVSNTSEAVYGYPPEEIMGLMHFYDKHPESEREEFKKAVFAVFERKGTFQNLESCVLTKYGCTVWMSTNGIPVMDDDGVLLGYCGTDTDISNHRRLQEQLHHSQKLESVGRLAGGVAHDFNNKLSVIMGYAQLTMEDLHDTSNIMGYMEEVVRAAEFSRDITSRLLAFSRQQIVSPRKVDANTVIRESIKSLPRLIGEDIQMKFHLCHDIWAVRIDPIQIDQIVMNLAVNARDAMPKGGTFSIETMNHTVDEAEAVSSNHPQGEFVMLSFHDNGTGMDEETLRHMFEPFFTTKEVGKGTGLGLSTVHGIVSQNGGFIDVESTLGIGTTFRVFFPRCVEAVQEALPDETPPAECCGSILLVEDDAAVRKMTSIKLERAGFAVTGCATPHLAIQCCEHAGNDFDLVVSDIVMPGMNGKEMMERIKVLRKDMKVLYMSGHSSEIISREGLLPEDVNFIRKPVNLNKLIKKIDGILNP